MNLKRNRPAALLACLLFVFALCIPVCAHDVPELDRLCSLTITLRDGENPVTGGTLTLYRVGEVAEDDGNYFFRPTGDFADCGESLDDLEVSADIAARLQAYAEENRLSPLAEQDVDASGNISFDGLPVGLYLICQQEAAPGYGALAPFLVSLPYLDNGVYVYDLTANPKTELEPEPTEPPTQPEEPPDLPYTGQLWWPVPVLACGGMLLLIVGVALNRRKHRDAR